MISVDTNVLARYLLNDDIEQAKASARLLAGQAIIDVPLSVWLELVWVLQINDCGKREIVKGLRHLIGLSNIRPQSLDVLLRTLGWYQEGMDFADALHLAMSAGHDHFASFDKTMLKVATKIGAAPQVIKP
ncbi:MAG: type II toxin-antitoxin system VapC family toxin [Burkholderiales bacterium]